MKKIPFFANLPDGTHCYQAALKMILTFSTGREWSFQELDKLSGKLAGKWTWPTASLIWLLKQDYEVKLIEEFNYPEFAISGKAYLEGKYGREVAKAQEENSDLPREQQLAEEFILHPNKDRLLLEYRVPSWKDLEQLFSDNYLIICNINACKLFGKAGYSGHFVVPIEISADYIMIHDPGLPPSPSLKIKREVFEEAWGYPTEKAKNILAIRK